MTVLAKICGLTEGDDARTADELGAAYLGVVLTPGFGRSVEAEHAARFLARTHAPRVAVLVDESPAEAARKATLVGASVVQLHGDESVTTVADLRARGDWTLWKAVRARSVRDVAEAVGRYGEWVDGVLVEGWREGVAGGGGVALALPPEAVRAAIPMSLRFILAGGLTAENVREAVALFQPDVVDVSSGVGAGPRRKDPDRVRAFLDEVAAALRPRHPGGAAGSREEVG
jgi:phosphoribosylanthranilate isomerase